MTTTSPNSCADSPATSTRLVGEVLAALVLLVLAAYLAFSFFDGRVVNFVAPFYIWMTPVTSAVLLVMAAACLWRVWRGQASDCHCHGEQASWLRQLLCVVIIIVPIGFGLTVNPRNFSVEGYRKRRLPTAARNVRFERAVGWVLGEETLKTAAETMDVELSKTPTVLEVLTAVAEYGPDALEGKPVTVIGQGDLLGDPNGRRFDLYRLVVTCCVADASSVSLEVARSAKMQVESGSWIRIVGELKFDSEFDSNLPVIHANKITRIPPPSSPYL